MSQWKTVRIKQELVEAVEKTLETSGHEKLSEFVTEAIRMRLDELKQTHRKSERPAEYPVIPDRLLYSLKHMWAMVTPEGNVRIGLSDYAQARMDGIAGVQTDQVGTEVKSEKPFGVIETWMFRFDLYSPVVGKIIKINKAVQDEPAILKKDPYEEGWIAEIRPQNLIKLEEELRNLMRPQQYKTWVSRLQRPRITPT